MSSLLHLLSSHVKRTRASSLRKQADPDKRASFRHRVFPSSSSLSVVAKVNNSVSTTSSPWDLLPVELQITIFAHCGVTDFLTLKLVCKAFSEIISTHEHSIARQYLRQRRHGTLPSPLDTQRTYTWKPEDDVVLLSDLFPPIMSAKGGHLYTFRYLHSLRRRQKLCSKLCYYLADRIVDRFVECETMFMKTSFSSRAERTGFRRIAMGRIWYYTLYFLESYADARREQTNVLLRDFEAGRLPVPIPSDIRKSMYQKLQRKIMQAPPFTDTSTLISTHHCLQLLVSWLQDTVPPDEASISDDSWIGSLLAVSPFQRTVEYFSAEIGDGGSQRMQRKDFMYNFYNDTTLTEKDEMNSRVFESAPNVHLHRSVQDVWFDVARAELSSRRVPSHKRERVMLYDHVPFFFGCSDCDPGPSDGCPHHLLNISWTSHRLSPLHHGTDCESLLNNPAALETYTTRLRDHLTNSLADAQGWRAAEDDPTTAGGLSSIGALQSCTWEPISTLSFLNPQDTDEEEPQDRNQDPVGLLITLSYESITYRAALLAAPGAQAQTQKKARGRGRRPSTAKSSPSSTYLPLLLTRLPKSLRESFIAFLSSNFDTYVSALRISSAGLCDVLERYVAALNPSSSTAGAGASAGSAASVEDIIREMHLTLSFAPPIAPSLKALNVSIPRETFMSFLRTSSSTGAGGERGRGSAVLSGLSAYLQKHLALDVGLPLPLPTSGNDGGGNSSLVGGYVRLTRVACAGFVVTGEGRLKVVAKGEGGEENERNRGALRGGESLVRAVLERAGTAIDREGGQD
ncbi:kinetochore complex Sim4 subunit Fta1-domain-containing protein [Aspergillus aurantiobrunneus]